MSAATSTSPLERCRAYLRRVPGAVEGDGGDNATFLAACYAVNDFGLSDADALSALLEWNAKCSPPWSDKDLHAKIEHARKYGKNPGSKVDEPPHHARGDRKAAGAQEDERGSTGPRPISQAEALALWDARGNTRSISTGIAELDEVLSGGLPINAVVVLVGPTGSYKTELTRHIGRHAAANGVLYLRNDYELTVQRLLERDLSNEADVPARRLRDGTLNAEEMKRVSTARAKLAAETNTVTYCPRHGEPLLDVLAAIAKACGQRTAVVVIDSLQRAAAGVDSDQQRLQVQGAMYLLEQFAHEHDVCVLVTSEQRRLTKSDDAAPVNTGAESRAIEYTADVLLVLEPQKREGDTASAAGGAFERRVGLAVRKNRLGDTGPLPVDLVFRGPCWAMEVAPRAEDDLEEKIDDVLDDDGWHKTDEIRRKVKRRNKDVRTILQQRLRDSNVEHDADLGWKRVPKFGNTRNATPSAGGNGAGT